MMFGSKLIKKSNTKSTNYPTNFTNPLKKGHIRVAAWNSNGLAGRIEELLETMVRDDISVCFVSETCIKGSNIIHPSIILSASAPSKKGIRQFYGLAVIIHPYFYQNHSSQSIITIEQVDPNTRQSAPNYVIATIFDKIRVAGIYLGPSLNQDDTTTIMNEILSLMPANNKYNYDVILGDFNMRVGELSGDTKTNPRGVSLNNILENARFSVLAPDHIKPTCLNALGSSIIDLIYTRSLMEQAQAKTLDGINLGSDHAIICITIPLDPITPIHVHKQRERGWNYKALNNQEIILNYSIHCKTELEKIGLQLQQQLKSALHNDLDYTEPQILIDNHYISVESCILNSARQYIGMRLKRKRQAHNWFFDDTVREKIHTRRTAYDKWKHCPPNSTKVKDKLWMQYVQSRNECCKFINDLRKTIFNDWCHHMDALPSHEIQKTFRCIINKKKNSQIHTLRNDTSSLQKYSTYFSKIYTPNERIEGPAPNNISSTTQEFTQPQSNAAILEDTLENHLYALKEKINSKSDLMFNLFSKEIIKGIIKSLPRGKAPGNSGMTNELLIPLADALTYVLPQFFSLVFFLGCIPSSWRSASIHPIYKKGNPSDITNYRPICLMENLRKCYERCLYPAVLAFSEPLSKTQNGFRHKRSTIDHVASLQEICISIKKKSPIYLAFLDIKNAYDKVDREILWRTIEELGFPTRLIMSLRDLYDNNSSSIRVLGKSSSPFALASGLVQGSILSPVLYSIFINDLALALNNGPKLTINDNGTRIEANNLFYADDICLITSNISDLNILLNTCEQHAMQHNYRFNTDKSAILFDDTTKEVNDCDAYLHNSKLPTVNTFTYLGVPFTTRGIDTKKILKENQLKVNRIGTILNRLGYNGYGLSYPTKRNLHRTYLRPIMEYCLSVIPYNNAQKQKLEAIQASSLRTLFSLGPTTCTHSLRILLGLPSMQSRKDILSHNWLLHLKGTNSTYHIYDLWKNYLQKVAANKKVKRLSVFSHFNGRIATAQDMNHSTILSSQQNNLNTLNTCSTSITDPYHHDQDNGINGMLNETDPNLMHIFRNRILKAAARLPNAIPTRNQNSIPVEVQYIYANNAHITSIQHLNAAKVSGTHIWKLLDPNYFSHQTYARYAILWLTSKVTGKPTTCNKCNTEEIATIAHMLQCTQAIQKHLPNSPNDVFEISKLLTCNVNEQQMSLNVYRFSLIIQQILLECFNITVTPPYNVFERKLSEADAQKMSLDRVCEVNSRYIAGIRAPFSHYVFKKSRQGPAIGHPAHTHIKLHSQPKGAEAPAHIAAPIFYLSNSLIIGLLIFQETFGILNMAINYTITSMPNTDRLEKSDVELIGEQLYEERARCSLLKPRTNQKILEAIKSYRTQVKNIIVGGPGLFDPSIVNVLSSLPIAHMEHLSLPFLRIYPCLQCHQTSLNISETDATVGQIIKCSMCKNSCPLFLIYPIAYYLFTLIYSERTFSDLYNSPLCFHTDISEHLKLSEQMVPQLKSTAILDSPFSLNLPPIDSQCIGPISNDLKPILSDIYEHLNTTLKKMLQLPALFDNKHQVQDYPTNDALTYSLNADFASLHFNHDDINIPILENCIHKTVPLTAEEKSHYSFARQLNSLIAEKSFEEIEDSCSMIVSSLTSNNFLRYNSDKNIMGPSELYSLPEYTHVYSNLPLNLMEMVCFRFINVIPCYLCLNSPLHKHETSKALGSRYICKHCKSGSFIFLLYPLCYQLSNILHHAHKYYNQTIVIVEKFEDAPNHIATCRYTRNTCNPSKQHPQTMPVTVNSIANSLRDLSPANILQNIIQQIDDLLKSPTTADATIPNIPDAENRQDRSADNSRITANNLVDNSPNTHNDPTLPLDNVNDAQSLPTSTDGLQSTSITDINETHNTSITTQSSFPTLDKAPQQPDPECTTNSILSAPGVNTRHNTITPDDQLPADIASLSSAKYITNATDRPESRIPAQPTVVTVPSTARPNGTTKTSRPDLPQSAALSSEDAPNHPSNIAKKRSELVRLEKVLKKLESQRKEAAALSGLDELSILTASPEIQALAKTLSSQMKYRYKNRHTSIIKRILNCESKIRNLQLALPGPSSNMMHLASSSDAYSDDDNSGHNDLPDINITEHTSKLANTEAKQSLPRKRKRDSNNN